EVLVVNRTAERGELLAAELGGRALPLEALDQALTQADVVIAAADAPQPLVTVAAASVAMRARNGPPLLAIDIGMPGDCEPDVAAAPGVTYYDLDDLQAIAAEHYAARASEIEAVQAIIEDETARFLSWWEQVQVTPTISALTDRAERVRATEIAK